MARHLPIGKSQPRVRASGAGEDARPENVIVKVHHVYRGVNSTTGEVYHGVSIDPERRRDGSHCVGGTASLAHWDCEQHSIRWYLVSSHRTQAKASETAHRHEREYHHPRGHRNIRTRGI